MLNWVQLMDVLSMLDSLQWVKRLRIQQIFTAQVMEKAGISGGFNQIRSKVSGKASCRFLPRAEL